VIHPHLGGAIPGGEWYSEMEVPDPSPLPEPALNYIVVRPVNVKGKTKSGNIVLPDSTKDDLDYMTTVGRVLVMGPRACNDAEIWGIGNRLFPACTVGDWVCYDKYSGTKFIYKGVKLLLMLDRQVLMKITTPEDIDPWFAYSKGSK